MKKRTRIRYWNSILCILVMLGVILTGVPAYAEEISDNSGSDATGYMIPSSETDDLFEEERPNLVNASTLTATSVYNSLISMKSVYPEGMTWTNANSYGPYYYNGIRYTGYGCAGFAFHLSNVAFGDLETRQHTNWDDIRVGDILRVNHDSHSVIVLSVDGDTITVAEGNYNSSIHWGRKISRSSLKNGSGTYIWTRWPEGTSTATSTVVADASKVDAFVVRLYNKVLGRNPDAAGRNNWNSQLIYGYKSGAEVAWGFVFSPEYLGKRTSNADYVEMLYNVFLNRASDSQGKQNWLAVLDVGMSREYVFRGFAESKEFTNICASYGIVRGSVALRQARDMNPNLTRYVNRLYNQILGRNGDEQGLNTWCANIQMNIKTPEEVALAFLQSNEFKNKHLSNSDYVKTLYRAFLGREYDSQGYNNWMSKLEQGVSRDEVAHQFAGSQEFRGIVKSFGL